MGVDVSTAVTQANFACLKGKGYNFAIVRAYRSSGTIDPNAVQTIKNAWNAKMAHVDAYIFPCAKCGNGPEQVSTFT
ncbi:unnamed protein product [Rotaria sordida]|uniref:Lysozyme n=1 Tax=Rotaria sordida TaxID=392033 RepID=A0A814SVM8_9BILA|nr:unnamed protein product [Rotaria sordida]CAF1151627.1 unnamed protein product [Rotaria sordida]